MGNSETKQDHHHSEDDPLRDYSTGVYFSSNISKPTTNLLLAYSEGSYYPCIILSQARTIQNGYLVYFLHNQVETEIPSSNVIGNFKALLNCKVSFTINGQQYVGTVYDISTNEKNEATNFFVTSGNQCAWVSFPFLFLTVTQARQLCA